MCFGIYMISKNINLIFRINVYDLQSMSKTKKLLKVLCLLHFDNFVHGFENKC